VARSSRRLGLALALAAGVFAVDQASKWLVRHKAAHLPYRVVGGLRIELNYNSGISFSRFAGVGAVVVALVAAVVVGVTAALFLAPPRYRLALGVILGGAVGNLADRLRFGGAVVDFLGVYGWPTFNLADAAIAVGTVILVLQVLRASRA
jgi:signal peptidase II